MRQALKRSCGTPQCSASSSRSRPTCCGMPAVKSSPMMGTTRVRCRPISAIKIFSTRCAIPIFAYSRSSTLLGLRYFNTSHSRYHGTPTLKRRCSALAPQKARLPTITSESQVGRNAFSRPTSGAYPWLELFLPALRQSRVPSTRLKGWLVRRN